MIKMNLNSRKKAIIGLGIVVPLVIFAVVIATPKNIRYSDAQLAPQNLERKVAIAEMIVIGTVKNVEVKVVKDYLYGDPSRGEPAVQELESLYQFVTIDAEKYLMDKTGKFTTEVTFRDITSGCFDALQFNCIKYEHGVEYSAGERALFFIDNVDGNLDSLGYVSKFKIDGDKVQSKYSEQKGEPSKKLSDFEAEINGTIEKQKAKKP